MWEDVTNTGFGLAVLQKLRKLDILNERGDDDAQRRALIANLDDMLSGPTYLAFTCRGQYRQVVYLFFPHFTVLFCAQLSSSDSTKRKYSISTRS